jgi:primosomal protein N' (replication factor Y)
MSGEQIELIGTPARRRRATRARQLAADRPVARVVLMTPVPHLDRVFDYAVPADLADRAVPGVRVRVRLAGRLVDGFVLERATTSDRELVPLSSVHGPPVLTEQVATLCRAVADRYAGTLADVLRFAVPPRHARAESRAPRDPAPVPPGPVPAAGWAAYGGGADLVAGVGAPEPVRALWVAGPAEDVPRRLAELAHAAALRGRGVLIVAPDGDAVDRLAAGLEQQGLNAVVLLAGAGPEARYRAFLSVLSGAARVVLGTRAAVYAPVADLGLIMVYDDGDESLAEPQAPGWHAREVAALRSAETDVSLVIAGTSVTLEAQRMAQAGWLRCVGLSRESVRSRMPRILLAADLSHGDPDRARERVPSAALEALRDGVAHGPVLVSVPRSGYLPMLACQGCREPVRCLVCSQPMAVGGPDRVPRCPQHGGEPGWRCPICAYAQVRSVVVGVHRTAEEFGRAMPGVLVLSSSGGQALRTVEHPRCVVVATPGAEPDPGPAGYAALVVLDSQAALSRPGLRVAEEVLRRWLAAAAMVRPAGAGGRVVVVGQPDVREVQALVRWDPMGYAARELEERRVLHLPPAVRIAQLTGPALPAGEVADEVAEGLGGRVLRRSGPLPGTGEDVVWLIAVSIADGPALASAVKRAQAVRSARRAPVVTVRMDPVRLR